MQRHRPGPVLVVMVAMAAVRANFFPEDSGGARRREESGGRASRLCEKEFLHRAVSNKTSARPATDGPPGKAELRCGQNAGVIARIDRIPAVLLPGRFAQRPRFSHGLAVRPRAVRTPNAKLPRRNAVHWTFPRIADRRDRPAGRHATEKRESIEVRRRAAKLRHPDRRFFAQYRASREERRKPFRSSCAARPHVQNRATRSPLRVRVPVFPPKTNLAKRDLRPPVRLPSRIHLYCIRRNRGPDTFSFRNKCNPGNSDPDES